MRTGDGGRNTNAATDWSTVICVRLASHEHSLTSRGSTVECRELLLGRASVSEGGFPDSVAFGRELGREDETGGASNSDSTQTTSAAELCD